jgi:hypothetical protein
MHTNEDGFAWYNEIEDAGEDGYAPVKVYSLLAFFMLKDKKTVINKENLVPIPALQYAYFGKQPDEPTSVYYVKDYRGWDAEAMYFDRSSLTFDANDEAFNIFRGRAHASCMWLLLTKEQVADMSAMLKRLYKAHFKAEGQLGYKLWLELAELSLGYEDYKEVGRNLLGFKTVCKIYEEKIEAVWEKAK